jgi:hypothetical protein
MAKKKPEPAKHSPNITTSTQEYIDIAEIRDDTVVLKNGTMRAVLLVSSINFALKSEEEQEAVIQGYITFLNSLDFPIQIVVQSRQLNIDKYLEELKKIENEQKNELLRMQTAEYRRYIEELVSLGEIMSKRFYLVVPYESTQDKKKGFLYRLTEIFTPATVIKLNEDKFREYKISLDRRVDQVMSGLLSFGITSAQLDTQSLIELYYNTYNPATSKNQKLQEVEKLQVNT